MKKIITGIAVLILVLLMGCVPKLDFDFDDYERQLVVEAYLVEDQPLQVYLHESVASLSLDSLPIVPNAVVTLTHRGETDTLNSIIPGYYLSEDTIRRDADPWFLRVEDPGTGRVATASTRYLPKIPIDTLWHDEDAGAWQRILLSFQDPPGEENYYRMTAFSPRDSLEDDFEFEDDLLDGENITLSSGYVFRRRDTVHVALYHCTQEYFDFLVSLRKAELAATAPVVEPGRVQSNVEGGLGVFVALSVERRWVFTRR